MVKEIQILEKMKTIEKIAINRKKIYYIERYTSHQMYVLAYLPIRCISSREKTINFTFVSTVAVNCQKISPKIV